MVILLFGPSRLSNKENVAIFSHVQQLISVQALRFYLNAKDIFQEVSCRPCVSLTPSVPRGLPLTSKLVWF